MNVPTTVYCSIEKKPMTVRTGNLLSGTTPFVFHEEVPTEDVWVGAAKVEINGVPQVFKANSPDGKEACLQRLQEKMAPYGNFLLRPL